MQRGLPEDPGKGEEGGRGEPGDRRPPLPPSSNQKRSEGREGGCVGGSTAVCVGSGAPGGRNGPERGQGRDLSGG